MSSAESVAKLIRYHADMAFLCQKQAQAMQRVSEGLMCCSLASVEHLSQANDLMREIQGRWCDVGDLFHESARKLDRLG